MSGYTGHVSDVPVAGFELIQKPFTERQLLASVPRAIDESG